MDGLEDEDFPAPGRQRLDGLGGQQRLAAPVGQLDDVDRFIDDLSPVGALRWLIGEEPTPAKIAPIMTLRSE